MEIIAKIIEVCANLGAGCASCCGSYQPQVPAALRK
ncbi:MAG TPA: hypothetical protein DCZ40_14265 [Lachnospiraceae bacterium]|nr:hypothetical protein [Lachnospiraceae bacterium]